MSMYDCQVIRAHENDTHGLAHPLRDHDPTHHDQALRRRPDDFLDPNEPEPDQEAEATTVDHHIDGVAAATDVDKIIIITIIFFIKLKTELNR